MKLLLHIGTEKTGTTTIQEALFRNRAALSNLGFHFLRCAGEKNNRALAAYCMRENRYDDFFSSRSIRDVESRNKFNKSFIEKFRRELCELDNTIHTVIISSEHFHSRTVFLDEVESLKHLLIEFFEEIEILIYLRPQADVAVSLYTTALKSGKSVGFEDFVFNSCVPENYYYNYSKILEQWSSVFSQGSLVPKIFSRREFIEGDLLVDFVSSIDSNIVSCLDLNVGVMNESVTHLGQSLLRSVNELVKGLDDRDTKIRVRREVLNLLSDRASGAGLGLTKEKYVLVQRKFDDINECVREKFFPKRNFLFKDRTVFDEGRILRREDESLIFHCLRTIGEHLI
ncbi:hypothetical protein SAMN04487965_2224 [Microbulbifer donghaiensis]|uniref:Sulfotransferase domain-containing protein n=1 Tax=Microbulbifer donghaiensis TaxID=494016 RepID=A0A1M5CK96_9GAMM|nr:hypothetical protein [Microbulbifer donghaiensis]SHF55129.1 hypothetical protein SAMN04487965_2224 [Microbulbifer donghaiensis]